MVVIVTLNTLLFQMPSKKMMTAYFKMRRFPRKFTPEAIIQLYIRRYTTSFRSTPANSVTKSAPKTIAGI